MMARPPVRAPPRPTPRAGTQNRGAPSSGFFVRLGSQPRQPGPEGVPDEQGHADDALGLSAHRTHAPGGAPGGATLPGATHGHAVTTFCSRCFPPAMASFDISHERIEMRPTRPDPRRVAGWGELLPEKAREKQKAVGADGRRRGERQRGQSDKRRKAAQGGPGRPSPLT